MSLARQHVPAFVDDDGPREVGEYHDEASLRAIPFVRRWTDDGYALEVSVDRPLALMAVRGEKFWVVAFLSDDVPSLPRWEDPA